MKSTTVAVDLAKSVFQLAVADASWKVIESHRLTRSQFERWFHNRDVSLVVMEACGSAHHWARYLSGLGIGVKLLPAKYVRAYVKRNKTDAADAAALLEALRASDIEPVRIKSIEQQALQGLHRTRSLWMSTRTSRINALRGFCREFGLVIPQGARTGVEAIARLLADPGSAIPELIRGSMKLLAEEIRLLEQRVAQLEQQLAVLAKQSPACKELLTVPGIGLLPLLQPNFEGFGSQLPIQKRTLFQVAALNMHLQVHPESLNCSTTFQFLAQQPCRVKYRPQLAGCGLAGRGQRRLGWPESKLPERPDPDLHPTGRCRDSTQ